MEVTVDEGTVYLIAAAYRIGLGEADAPIPVDLLVQCVKLIEANSSEEWPTNAAAEVSARKFAEDILSTAESFEDEDGYFVADQVRVRAKRFLAALTPAAET